MLTIYWLCFAIGGVFVLLAVLSGLDGVDFGDADFDVQVDELDDIELQDPGDSDAANRVFSRRGKPSPLRIVKSLRFWTFGLCFFGLTGLVLSNLSVPLPPWGVAIAAISMGIVCGAIVAGMLQALRQHGSDSLIRSDDLVGLMATVELPFNQNSRGKVRLMVKGSLIDMVAYTEDAREFYPGDRVLIVGTEENRLWVVSADSLNSAAEPPT